MENKLWEGRERLLGATRLGGEVVVLKEKLTQVALGLNTNLVLALLSAG